MGEGFRRAKDYGGATSEKPTFFPDTSRKIREKQPKMVKKSVERISAGRAARRRRRASRVR